MADKDKVKINITIADERIELNADIDRIREIRNVETAVDDLYRNWRKRFPLKTTQQLLAMMAYQYASFYFSLDARMKQALADAEAIEHRLDAMDEPEG